MCPPWYEEAGVAVAIISPIGSPWDHPLVPPAAPGGAASRSGMEAEDAAGGETPSRERGAVEPSPGEGGSAPAVPDATARASQPSEAAPREDQGGQGGQKDPSGQAAGQESQDAQAPGGRRAINGRELSRQELAELQKLQQRDREVRAHEQAHKAAGGRYVRGGARYQYRTGPDGRHYAVGGEVSIDTSEASSPEATIRKAQAIKRAALAPAQPSPQDRQVAAQAAQMEQKARAELARQRQEEARLAGEQKAAGAREQGQAGRVGEKPDRSGSAAQAAGLFPPPQSAAGPPPLSVRMNPLNLMA